MRPAPAAVWCAIAVTAVAVLVAIRAGAPTADAPVVTLTHIADAEYSDTTGDITNRVVNRAIAGATHMTNNLNRVLRDNPQYELNGAIQTMRLSVYMGYDIIMYTATLTLKK